MRTIAHTIPLLILAAPALAQGVLFDLEGQPGDYLGQQVFRLGDLDGDGLEEFGVTARPQQGPVETRVHRGSDGSLLKIIQGLPLGDLDGDGVADRRTDPPAGSIDVLSGDSGPLLWTIQAQSQVYTLEVSDLGDVNVDGAGDLLVGEYLPDPLGGPGSLEFSVRSGPDGSVLRAWQYQRGTWPLPDARVAPLGDVDGDGVSEIIEVTGTTARVVTALTGQELSSWTVPSVFGRLVTGGTAGADADGDGTPDFALSESDTWAHEDRFTFVFSGASGQLLQSVKGVGAVLGPDIDGDGRADLAVADLPDVLVVSGATGASLRSVRPGLSSVGWFGGTLGLLPDLDGDGQGELIVPEVGYPSSAQSLAQIAGRVRVYDAAYSDEIGSALAASGCPCGNAGSAGTGCGNSTGGGARLFALGSTSVSEGHLVLGATQTPALEGAVLFTGPAPLGTPRPFGGGLLLLATPYRRVATHQTGQLGLCAWNDYHGFPQIPDTGAPFEFHQTFQAGQTYRFQVWYTDAADPCGKGFNLTSAVELTMTP